jgi:cytochrome b subunit of formate dehydrogenase
MGFGASVKVEDPTSIVISRLTLSGAIILRGYFSKINEVKVIRKNYVILNNCNMYLFYSRLLKK